MANYSKITYHRDGSITIWDELRQRWLRCYLLPDDLAATLSSWALDRIARHLNRGACGNATAG